MVAALQILTMEMLRIPHLRLLPEGMATLEEFPNINFDQDIISIWDFVTSIINFLCIRPLWV
jgi:hypothetical protein